MQVLHSVQLSGVVNSWQAALSVCACMHHLVLSSNVLRPLVCAPQQEISLLVPSAQLIAPVTKMLAVLSGLNSISLMLKQLAFYCVEMHRHILQLLSVVKLEKRKGWINWCQISGSWQCCLLAKPRFLVVVVALPWLSARWVLQEKKRAEKKKVGIVAD